MTLLTILAATAGVSLLSLAGAVLFTLHDDKLHSILPWLVAFAAGALMGGAFLHLIPRSLAQLSVEPVFLVVLTGFALFFVIEKYLHWHHCHDGECDVETYAYMNLVGELVHNFIDGLVIAAAFLTNTGLGIATTLAVALHETPQELGDFGVLLHGGFSKTRALSLNLAVAGTAVIGGVAGYYLSTWMSQALVYLLPFAAGGFLYIAAVDLVPEIHSNEQDMHSAVSFAVFLLGIALLYGVKHLPLT